MPVVQVMWVIDIRSPLRQPRAWLCELRHGIYSWALPRNTASHVGRRRCLIGASAFFTEASAKRARLGLLLKLSQKLDKHGWLGRQYPNLEYQVARAIAEAK